MQAIVFGTSELNRTVDVGLLEREVKKMYEQVATQPNSDFHFETGAELALSLGYDGRTLRRVPASACESFAGVGFHLDLPNLKEGERVLDLGSGSGMDSFYAAQLVGTRGRVVGVDFTSAQRRKAIELRNRHGFESTEFVNGRLESPPFEDGSFDCVISNGVINLVVDKDRVFREAARVLKPGGRLALSDIVTTSHLPESVVCDANLWASCIGGAMHRAEYLDAIEAAGFQVELVRLNPQYNFKAGRAERSARKFGVMSLSVLATKK